MNVWASAGDLGTASSKFSGDYVLLGFSLTVKVATLIFISGRCSAISSTKQGNSGLIYNLVKS